MKQHTSNTRVMSDQEVVEREKVLKELQQLGSSVANDINSTKLLNRFCQRKTFASVETYKVKRRWGGTKTKDRTLKHEGKALEIMRDRDTHIWLAMTGSYAISDSGDLTIFDLSTLHLTTLLTLKAQMLQIQSLLNTD